MIIIMQGTAFTAIVYTTDAKSEAASGSKHKQQSEHE